MSCLLFFVAFYAPAVLAAETADSELTQTINAGALSTGIYDAGGAVVNNPAFALNNAILSTSQQTSTGSFGSNSQRITVDNPGAAAGGWTLALAGADTCTDNVWNSGSNTYRFDGSAAQGQLTISPNLASLTAQVGTTANVTLGTEGAFNCGITDSITLMSASNQAAPIWRGYLTGVGLSQTIPASQPAGSYTLDLVQTVTAN